MGRVLKAVLEPFFGTPLNVDRAIFHCIVNFKSKISLAPAATGIFRPRNVILAPLTGGDPYSKYHRPCVMT